MRVVEQADYLGGRLFTVKHDEGLWQYEAGGARFHDGHRRLRTLLRKLRLGAIPLPGDFMHVPIEGPPRPVQIDDARRAFCAPALGPAGRGAVAEDLLPRDAVESLRQEVGYDAEFQLSHAEDCQRSVCQDLAVSKTFYVVKEGFSELIDRLVTHARRHGVQIETGTSLLGYTQRAPGP